MNVRTRLERRLFHRMLDELAMRRHVDVPVGEFVMFGTQDVLEAYAHWSDEPVEDLTELYMDDEIEHDEFEWAIERVFEAVPSLVDET